MKQPLALLMGCLALGGSYLISRQNYLLFHSLAEVFSIVIAGGIFMIAWNARAFLKNDYLMLVGIAYLFIGSLDLIHTLSYSGMGIFTDHGANLPTQLWIAARYMESLSLLLAPIFLGRRLKAEFLLILYALATVLILLSIFAWDLFPDCFVEGEGLTAFKRYSEYAICLVLVAALGMLLQHRQNFDAQVLRWLIYSIMLTIAAELSFTFYVHVYGLSNLVGHYLKIASFYFMYRAIIETGLAKPYALLLRDVRTTQEQLIRANEELEQKVIERTAELQETVADLERFSYSIVHDMRAPLRSMNSFAKFLLEENNGNQSPTTTDYLMRISSAARRMDLLIRDVLSYSQVVLGKASLSQIDLDVLVREIVRDYPAFQPERADIAIVGTLHPVLANTALLTLCVSNLLGNAVKFVPKETKPRVRIWSEAIGEEWIKLVVEDAGIGIAEEHMGRIWGMFERLHHNDDYEGTGIGLSVVKRAIERMHGQVGVESRPGFGSRFWIQLKSGAPRAEHGSEALSCPVSEARD
jgi:signal transduction histidine kinase